MGQHLPPQPEHQLVPLHPQSPPLRLLGSSSHPSTADQFSAHTVFQNTTHVGSRCTREPYKPDHLRRAIYDSTMLLV